MTNSQKERISHMRLNGESYAGIAYALGLSRNTVKSFCLRTSAPNPMRKRSFRLAKAFAPSAERVSYYAPGIGSAASALTAAVWFGGMPIAACLKAQAE